MRPLTSFLLGGLLLVATARPARADLIFDFQTQGGNLVPFFPATLGYAFTVSGSPVRADGLGLWESAFVPISGSFPVGLWDASGTLLASATITDTSTPVPSASPNGRWLFEDVSPVVLQPGTYVLGAYGSNFFVTSGDPLLPAPGATWVEGRQNSGSFGFPADAFAPPPFIISGSVAFGPNLRATALTAPVPEPGTLAAFCLGTVALIGYCRRRGRHEFATQKKAPLGS